MLLRQTADVLFSHLQVPLQSLFLAPAYPPPAKRGFTCPGHLQVATARRLAALETLVPNPPNQPTPNSPAIHPEWARIKSASALRLGNLNNSTSTAEAGHSVAAAGSLVSLLQQRHGSLCSDWSWPLSSSSVPSCCSALSLLPNLLTASSREEMCQLLIAG